MSRYTIVQTSFGLIYLLNVQINLALLNGIAIYSSTHWNKKIPRHICTNMAVF